MSKIAKNTICLWYERGAEEAALFYARAFPDSTVGAVHRAPGDFPSGKQGDVLTVEFTVMGIPCLGLNGGPAFKHNEAFSFQVATEDQAETDRYWSAIVGNGGQESECGWCKDKWGISWQITPVALIEPYTSSDPDAALSEYGLARCARWPHPVAGVCSRTYAFAATTRSGVVSQYLSADISLNSLSRESTMPTETYVCIACSAHHLSVCIGHS